MGKRIAHLISIYWVEILLGLFTFAYIAYFSWFTILRYRTLYAHYFDLGIMNQTAYNTFMSFKTGDFSRFLELTNPHGFDQIKRMAVHNDIFLALLAPFYFIYSGPETLLVIQTIAIALGALIVFGIGMIVFEKVQNKRIISLVFSCAYLMYPPLQRANQFDFHAVVLATPLLLFMFYWFLKKRYGASILCAIFVLLTKEQVGLTISFFGFYIIFKNIISCRLKTLKKKDLLFGSILVIVGIGWFALSMTKIIPTFRQGVHFALGYFGDFGDSPQNIFIGLLKNPLLVLNLIFRKDTLDYFYTILGPLGFLSVLSPIHLLIAMPELAINLFSKSGAMRNIYFHYTAVITPFVMISAFYGFHHLLSLIHSKKRYTWLILIIFISCVIFFSTTISPLPYSQMREIHPIIWPSKERFDANIWQQKLSNENIKVMASGHIAPLFSSRRYLYNFSERFDLADYIVISTREVYNSYGSEVSKPVYKKLVIDKRFVRIYKNNTFEVYKKI